VKAAGVVLAIVAALAVQTTLARFSGVAVDLVLVVAVFAGLSYGPVAGLFTGTVGGLAQDALSAGVLGLAGLSKTVAGFGAGVVGSQFIVAHPLPRFAVFVGATLAHEACFEGLNAILEARGYAMGLPRAIGQAVLNGFVGVLAFHLVDSLPGVVERRRSERTRLARRL